MDQVRLLFQIAPAFAVGLLQAQLQTVLTALNTPAQRPWLYDVLLPAIQAGTATVLVLKRSRAGRGNGERCSLDNNRAGVASECGGRTVVECRLDEYGVLIRAISKYFVAVDSAV